MERDLSPMLTSTAVFVLAAGARNDIDLTSSGFSVLI